jgi:hypothetical protein
LIGIAHAVELKPERLHGVRLWRLKGDGPAGRGPVCA